MNNKITMKTEDSHAFFEVEHDNPVARLYLALVNMSVYVTTR